MLVHLSTTIPVDTPRLDGVLMGVNYGLNKVRFINPVPAGSRIRATSQTIDVVLKGNAIDMTRLMTVDIEGQEKPALIAEWIGRTVLHEYSRRAKDILTTIKEYGSNLPCFNHRR